MLAAQTFSTTTNYVCHLYTSDAADERSSVDLGGRRIIKKKKKKNIYKLQHNMNKKYNNDDPLISTEK